MRSFPAIALFGLIVAIGCSAYVEARPCRGGFFASRERIFTRTVTRTRVNATGCQTCPQVVPVPIPAPSSAPKKTAFKDALDEVNAARAARGLRPYILDGRLAEAAQLAAQYRAERRIAGHTSNDFGFLPVGSDATAAGCAAWPSELGWGACCTYEAWTYAGAAVAVGPDGQRYMHLFVR